MSKLSASSVEIRPCSDFWKPKKLRQTKPGDICLFLTSKLAQCYQWSTQSLFGFPIHFLVPFKKILRHACSLSSWDGGPTFHFNSIPPVAVPVWRIVGGWGQTRIAVDCNSFRNQGLAGGGRGPNPKCGLLSLSPLLTALHTWTWVVLHTSHLQRFHWRIYKLKERELCEVVVW
jgi:hypothetical protein